MPQPFVKKIATFAVGVAMTFSLAFSWVSPAEAQVPAPAYTFNGIPQTTGNGGSYVFGNSFTVGSLNVYLTSLGYAAPGGITGQTGTLPFGESHDVGLYDSSGTLLASITLDNTNATTVINGFRYASAGSGAGFAVPVLLTAGQTYTVAGTTGQVDPYAGYTSANTTTSPLITNNGGRIANSTTLVNPQTALLGGLAGPNFLVVVEAPEPGALALLASGGIPVLGLALRRRRSRKA